MKLKEIRIKNNLTQKDIAKIINKTHSGYGYYESGRTEPDINTLIKLADFYHVTLDELVGREQQNTIDKGMLREQEAKIIDIMQQLNNMWLDKLEGYAVAFLTTQNEQNEIIRKIKGEQ